MLPGSTRGRLVPLALGSKWVIFRSTPRSCRPGRHILLFLTGKPSPGRDTGLCCVARPGRPQVLGVGSGPPQRPAAAREPQAEQARGAASQDQHLRGASGPGGHRAFLPLPHVPSPEPKPGALRPHRLAAHEPPLERRRAGPSSPGSSLASSSRSRLPLPDGHLSDMRAQIAADKYLMRAASAEVLPCVEICARRPPTAEDASGHRRMG